MTGSHRQKPEHSAAQVSAEASARNSAEASARGSTHPAAKGAEALAEMACVPCAEGVPPLKPEEIARLLPRLEGWEVVEEHHLTKTYRFSNFAEALAFVNRVGDLAETVGHHPDLHLAWGRVGVEIWTHKINGLSESDFVFSAKCDRLFA